MQFRIQNCVVLAGVTLSIAVGVPTNESAACWDENQATSTTIRRDRWGVAHIHGRTHADAFFGMGYAQAEDYFWQLEDTCIRALGRYAEVVGEEGLQSDILNRSFEVVRRSRQDFRRLDPQYQDMASAFAAGINRYLADHPEESPRLIRQFQAWHIMAMDRHLILDFIYRQIHIGKPGNRNGSSFADVGRMGVWSAWDLQSAQEMGFENEVREATGSNAWAVSGRKTNNGHPLLFINPHQPWYGMGQFYEAHVQSDEGLNFTGACFFGNPFPTIGHNEHLGWSYTVNSPDIADAWRVTFDHESEPLKYRYADGYRLAKEWTETLSVRSGDGLIPQIVTFRKTHHGPIVRKEATDTFLAAQVSGLFDPDRMDQAWGMVLANNFSEWKAAFQHCAIPMFNVVYADDQDNIFYAYNGSIPVRDDSFDWRRPVDGSNPRTDWMGVHTFSELPQLLNPSCGYVQSCNSAPFTTTHDENPSRDDFPNYMVEDADIDMRRSKMSRLILRNANALTLKDWQELAYDTRLYWAMTEIPDLAEDYSRLQLKEPQLADEIAEYWSHLQDWDFRSSVSSTQTTLVVAWYEQLYGFGYPAETLKPEFRGDRTKWFQGLRAAADKLSGQYGTWKHPWGEAHRLQRLADQPDVKHAGVGLSPFFESLPCPGAPGPLGIVFTVYSTPEIPFLRTQRFAVVGASYMATVEFGSEVEAWSVMPFGASGRRKSPHFFDQAELYSNQRLKPAWYSPEEIEANTKRVIRLSRLGPHSNP